MLLTWSLIYIWHELFLTPKYGIGKVSLPSPELMLSCCECVYSVCILWALIFKHLLKYAIILVSFSFLLYACQWTIRLFIFFSLCLFVCIYFIVWITSCTNGDLNPSNFVRSCIFGGLKLNDCVCPTFSQRFTSRSYPQAYTVIQIPFFNCKSWEGGLLWLKEVMMTSCSLWNF